MFLRQETQGPKLMCTPGPELHTTVVVHQEARSDPGVHAGAALLTTMVSHKYLPRYTAGLSATGKRVRCCLSAFQEGYTNLHPNPAQQPEGPPPSETALTRLNFPTR